MRFIVYLRGGKAFMPTEARTEAGYWLDVDPVEVVEVANRLVLMEALRRLLKRGNPVVPTPTGSFPKPIVLQYAGLKSWSAFARSATCWYLTKEGKSYSVTPCRDAEGGGWEEDSARREEIPEDAPIDFVLERFVDRLTAS